MKLLDFEVTPLPRINALSQGITGINMTLDVRGSLKNTKISSNKYVAIEELISNSIDSFLIRRDEDPSKMDLRVAVSIRLFDSSLLGDQLDISISCTDNGCGLGEEQTDAFLTKDTSYKDDLSIAGIGKCKGAGRIQFFHSFEKFGLRSTYRDNEQVLTRALPLVGGRKRIEPADFTVTSGQEEDIGTTITLEELKSVVRERFHRTEPLEQAFSASNVRRHMLMAFLQRLVSLKAELGDFTISFETECPNGPEKRTEKANLSASDLPPITAQKSAFVEQRDPRSGSLLGRRKEFRLSHYRLDEQSFDLPRNAISFCAKSSPVLDITRRYLRTLAEQNNPVGGYHHIVLIEGDLLDQRVNEQRDGFEGIPSEIPVGDLFVDETVSYEGIYDAIDPIIDAMVTPTGWTRDEVIHDVAEKFGILPRMISETETRVVYGDSAKSVAERVLKKYQERIITDDRRYIRPKARDHQI